MAEHYIPGEKRGRDMHETWDEYTDGTFETVRTTTGLEEDDKAVYVDAVELGHDMIDNYYDEYDDDDDWIVICTEERFSLLIPHPEQKKQAIAKAVGTFDLVIRQRSTGYIYLVDHKTAAGFGDLAYLNLDDQAGSYIAFATFVLRESGMIGPRESIRGMLYNFARKAKIDTRPMNREGKYTNKPLKKHYLEQMEGVAAMYEDFQSVTSKMTIAKLEEIASRNNFVILGDESKQQPPPYFLRHMVDRTPKERNAQIRRAGNDALVMRAFREGVVPIIKAPTKECSWCDFFDLCQVDESGGDTEGFKESAYKIVDPYMDHRDGAENSKTTVKADKRRLKK